jgi:hypothetical protein
METPAQTAARLLDALQDLVAQEAVIVRAGDYAELAALQARTAALGDKLGELAANPAVLALRGRVEATLAQRRQSQAMLEQRLAGARAEIQRLHLGRQRLGQVAPAYGRGMAASSRLNAAA